MHWLDRHPDDTLDRYNPSAALDLLRMETDLKWKHIYNLDRYLTHWTFVALQSNSSHDVQVVVNMLEVASSFPTASDNVDVLSKWAGFEQLLEMKRNQLKDKVLHTSAADQPKDLPLELVAYVRRSYTSAGCPEIVWLKPVDQLQDGALLIGSTNTVKTS